MASIADALVPGRATSRRLARPNIAKPNPAPTSTTDTSYAANLFDQEEGASAGSMGAGGRAARHKPAELTDPVHWIALGVALRESGQYGKARTAFREARRLAPQGLDAALELAHLEMECGRHQHAYDMFMVVLDRLPARLDITIRAARACFELGSKKHAKLLIEGWQNWPLDDEQTTQLAALMIEVGKMRDGLSVLKRVPDLARTSTYALAWLASSLAQTSHLKKARHCLALLPSPENISNPALRESLLTTCARIALKCGHPFGARRYLEFLETSPAPGLYRSAKPYFLLAEICVRQMDMEAARSAMLAGHCMRMRASDIASPLMIGFT